LGSLVGPDVEREILGREKSDGFKKISHRRNRDAAAVLLPAQSELPLHHKG
jgi:hypothetical protein